MSLGASTIRAVLRVHQHLYEYTNIIPMSGMNTPESGWYKANVLNIALTGLLK